MQPVQPKYGYGMTVSACLWLGLFPLLQCGTYSSITHDKWVIMLVLSGVTLLCFLFDLAFSVIRGRRFPAALFRPRPLIPLLLAAALLLWTVLSCLCSEYGPDTWWLGGSARYEGLLTQLCYLGLFFCFFFSRVSLKPVVLSGAAGLAVFFVIVMLQRGGGNPLGLYPAGRSYELNPEFQGTIGNIDMGTGYLLLLFSLFLYSLLGLACAPSTPDLPLQLKPKEDLNALPLKSLLQAAVSLIGLCISLFLILTMDVQFGAISLGVLLLFTALRFLPKKRRLPLLILLIVLALLIVWIWPGHGGGLWELHEVFHGRARLSFGSNRLAVWYYSLRLSALSPVVGGGSASFPSRFNRYLSDNGLTIPDEQDGVALPNYFDNPHSEYISQLTDHGLPAMLLFLALLLWSVFRRRDGWLPLPSPCSAAVLCYAVQAVFSFSVCIIAPMFWILLGLSFSEQE